MKVSFKSDANSVKDASKGLEIALSELKSNLLKKELKQSDELDSSVKLIEKLSILNEYKLNLFKEKIETFFSKSSSSSKSKSIEKVL